MLTNSLKILHTTKKEFFDLIFFQSHQKIWQKYCREDLCSVLEPLTCWMPISVLTQVFLGISVTLLFPAYISEANNLWSSSFFRKYSKLYVDFWNAEKNSKNVFRYLDNCIWIGCVKHSLLLRENTFHRVSIC